MFIPHEPPGNWQSFLKRKDNVGLTIMEARQKYLKEQLLFENYINTLNTVSTVSTAAAGAGAAGGPPKQKTGGGGASEWAIEFKVNTNYNITTGYYDVPNPTTRLNLNFSTTNTQAYSWGAPFTDGNTWNGDVTIDWGDGTVETKTGYDVGGADTSNVQSNWYGKIGLVQHNYASDGEYIVKIKGPGAYYLRFMFTPLVDLITYDPSLTEDFRCLFAYMPLAATQNFEGDISNWVIPAGKSLDCVAGCSGKYQNFASNAVKLQYGFAINISDWDISGITSLERAFAESNGFNSTQIANWAVPSTCTNLRKIFKQVGSAIASYGTSDSNIKNLDVSEWNTSRVQIWEQAFYETHWNGVGMNSLDFSGIYATGFDANTLYYSLGGAFTVRINTVALETFPAVPDWNFGGDAAVHYQQFPGLDNPFGDYIGWISGVVGQFPMNKTNWGTTLVGWANNADMTTNSNLYVANFGSGYNDFDYSGDAPVAAALTTLQNTKGWTLTGFTF